MRGYRRLVGPHFEFCHQSPNILGADCDQSYLVLLATLQLPGPDHAKFRPILPVLQHQEAAHFEPAANCAQPRSALRNVQRVRQFIVGLPGCVTPKDPHRQNRLQSMIAPFLVSFLIHFSDVLSNARSRGGALVLLPMTASVFLPISRQLPIARKCGDHPSQVVQT
jgi:hypothetical protein